MRPARLSNPTPAQVAQIARLHRAVLTRSFFSRFPPALLTLAYWYLIRLCPSVLFVVQSRGQIIAFALAFSRFTPLQLLHPRFTGPELQLIAVDPRYQRQGLGRQLVNLLNQHFRRLGVIRYWVGTHTSDSSANAFYRRLGFVLTGQTEALGSSLNYYSYAP